LWREGELDVEQRGEERDDIVLEKLEGAQKNHLM